MGMYRVRYQLTGQSVNGNSVSTFFLDDTGGTPQQAATAVNSFWSASAATLSDELSILLDTEVDQVDEGDGSVFATTTVASFAVSGASSTTDTLPQALQALLRIRTGVYLGGREIRGRLFLPGFTEGMSAQGLPIQANLDVVNAAALTLIGAANAQWVCWSRVHGTFEPVTSASCWNRFAVLRSRRD